MLSRKVLLCWYLLLSVGINGQPVKFRSSSDECMPELVKKRIKYCLNRELIVNRATFNCFKVNSQGDCNEGERLVVMKESECKVTKCVENKYRGGEPCLGGLLAYNGMCMHSGSKTACKDTGLGKRLHADLYGNVTCRCAVDLDYVDVNGTCYHSYTRGPCKAGEQIVRNGLQGGKCLKHTCDQGTVIKLLNVTSFIYFVSKTNGVRGGGYRRCPKYFYFIFVTLIKLAKNGHKQKNTL